MPRPSAGGAMTRCVQCAMTPAGLAAAEGASRKQPHPRSLPCGRATTAPLLSRSRSGRRRGCARWRCTRARRHRLREAQRGGHSTVNSGVILCTRSRHKPWSAGDGGGGGGGPRTVRVPHFRREADRGWPAGVLLGEGHACVEEAALATSSTPDQGQGRNESGLRSLNRSRGAGTPPAS